MNLNQQSPEENKPSEWIVTAGQTNWIAKMLELEAGIDIPEPTGFRKFKWDIELWIHDTKIMNYIRSKLWRFNKHKIHMDWRD